MAAYLDSRYKRDNGHAHASVEVGVDTLADSAAGNLLCAKCEHGKSLASKWLIGPVLIRLPSQHMVLKHETKSKVP